MIDFSNLPAQDKIYYRDEGVDNDEVIRLREEYEHIRDEEDDNG